MFIPRRFRGRTLLRALAAAVVVVAAWTLMPWPFARGVIVGALALSMSLVVGLLVGDRFLRRRLEAQLQPPPLPVAAWDYAMDAETLDGERVAFSRFAGKVLILNFWATWCAPCVAEMPSLEGLRAATADLDVQMACVTSEDGTEVRAFARKRSLAVPVFLLSGKAPEPFRIRGVPATFVLDKGGRVVLRHVGAAAWDHESVVTFVRGLAATPG